MNLKFTVWSCVAVRDLQTTSITTAVCTLKLVEYKAFLKPTSVTFTPKHTAYANLLIHNLFNDAPLTAVFLAQCVVILRFSCANVKVVKFQEMIIFGNLLHIK
jgi:hypothetical protein